MTNADFADFDDYEPTTEGLEPYEAYLSVRGLLCLRFGKEHGDEVYALLQRAAQGAADEIDAPTTPGIIFNDDGGEFVGFEANPESTEEYYN
jgi:hypothetical protein